MPLISAEIDWRIYEDYDGKSQVVMLRDIQGSVSESEGLLANIESSWTDSISKSCHPSSTHAQLHPLQGGPPSTSAETMQKVLRRTALAKNQAKRKKRILDEKIYRRDRSLYRIYETYRSRHWQKAMIDERARRREDYELGPLAPWRMPPHMSEMYGAFDPAGIQYPEVPERDRVKDWLIRVGDRVAVAKGREGVRGKIGKVTDCDVERQTVTLEDVNRVDIRIPPHMQQPGSPNVMPMEMPVPLADVQLVYPLPDPDTGIPRDVILPKLKARNFYFDRYKNRKEFDRVLVQGRANVVIPWPEEEEPEEMDNESDTLRISVEEKTFLPTLLRPPMPNGVIDELRNRYSKFRDRHDDEFVEKKTKEDEQVQRHKELSKRMIPRGARNVARTIRGETLGWKKSAAKGMDDETLEAIGRRLAEMGFEAKDKTVIKRSSVQPSAVEAATV